MISIKNLNKHYGKQNSKYHALKNINLELPGTGFICILGQSGSGKTTLMNIIGSLDTYDSGNVTFKGKELKKFTEEEVAKYRSMNVGFIFQDYNVIDKLTVEENVNLAINVQGKSSLDKVHDYLDIVELKGLEKRKINELSGGQKQRVAIARALIKEPDILLCDEATGNVDSNTSAIVANIIKKISKEKLVIFVTHDRDLALNYADRIINIKDGEITSDEDNSGNSDKFKMKFSKSFGSNVSREEVVDAIKNAKNLNVELELSINPSNSSVTNNDLEVSSKIFRDKTKKAKSAWKYFVSLAVDNIRQRKLRTFVVMMTFLLVLTITSTSRSISTYSPARDYVAIMEKYGGIAYTLNLEGDFYDDNYDSWTTRSYTSGKYAYNEAVKSVGSENLVFSYNTDFSFEPDVGGEYLPGLITDAEDQLYYVEDDFDFSRYNFIGNAPSNEHELVVTSAVARAIFGEKSNVNDYIGMTYDAYGFRNRSTGTYNFEIAGIIDTDYSGTYVEEYLEDGSVSNSDSTILWQQFNTHLAIFTHEEFFEYQYYSRAWKYETLTYSTDLLNSVGYQDSSSFYSDSELDYYNKSVIGDRISAKDEILISADVFNMYCFNGDSNKYLSFEEINQQINDNVSGVKSCYDDLINMEVIFGNYTTEYEDLGIYHSSEYPYDPEEERDKRGLVVDFNAIYPDGAKIVGISDVIAQSNTEVIDYIIHDDAMNNIYEQTITSKRSPNYAPSDESLEQVDNLVNNDFKISSSRNHEPFESVESATELLDFFLTPTVLAIITIVLILIPTLFMFLFTNISIDLKKKEIGILKSIGSSNNQVMSIFLIQSALIALFSLVVATIGGILITNAISSIVFEEAMQYGVIGYVFTTSNFIYMFILTFIICFVSILIPYIQFNKKPPINIVKDL